MIFFSVSIPNERISKDKLSYKNQFKDSYDLIKPIKDYALNNSDVFNESQEKLYLILFQISITLTRM